MKKLTVLILVLAMLVSLFAACEQKKEENILDTAVEYIRAMYKKDDGSATAGDYTVVGVVNINGSTFDVVWTTDAETVKIVPDAETKMVTIDVDEESPAEVNYTITATVTDAEGNTASCSFKHTVPEYKVLTVADVLTLDDGAAIVMSGTVTSIDTAWSEQYGNISVYVEDEAGNSILCYRLGTNVTVGDVITVKGTVGSYNGKKQIAQGATAVITGHVEIKVEFAEKTLAEANATEDGTGVQVSGVVTNIGTEWSEQYGNISVTITDKTGSLYIYRLATKVELGDAIVVKGNMGSYNGSKQIAAGATAEIEGNHAAATLAEATAAEDGTLVKVTGTVKTIDTEWSEQYGNISVTIEDETGATLYLYRLATNVEVGDVITVYGKVGSYKEAKQIAAGAFAFIAE